MSHTKFKIFGSKSEKYQQGLFRIDGWISNEHRVRRTTLAKTDCIQYFTVLYKISECLGTEWYVLTHPSPCIRYHFPTSANAIYLSDTCTHIGGRKNQLYRIDHTWYIPISLRYQLYIISSTRTNVDNVLYTGVSELDRVCVETFTKFRLCVFFLSVFWHR